MRSSLAGESLLFAGRLFTRWRRAPTVPIQALLFPTFFLITYKLMVGKSILRITGTDSLYGLVPMCAVAGAMFGALGAGLTIIAERDSGLLSQLWVLPVNRASALTGRLLAEAAAYVGGYRTDHSGRRCAWTSIRRRLARRDPVRTGSGAGSSHLLHGSNRDRGAFEEQRPARLAIGAVRHLGVRQLWRHSRSNVAIVDPATDTAAADGADD